MRDTDLQKPTADLDEESVGDDVAVKVIKRYSNRKLYDTLDSRYVTLEEVAEMVREGVELRIVDNRTKEDLTSVTLAQILFEGEKRDQTMPLGMLKRLIRHGGHAVSDFISGQVTTRVEALREEAGERVTRLFRRDETAGMREVFTTSQRALEEWQRRVDERVRGAVEALTGLTHLQREVVRLHERLDALEGQIGQLEATAGAEPADSDAAAVPPPASARNGRGQATGSAE